MIETWTILGWGILVGTFFLVTMAYVGKKTGTNFIAFWWRARTSSIKTERRFGDEVKSFPVINFLYGFFKWSTPVVIVAWLVFVVMKSM